MDTDAAKELKELREPNARLKRLLAEAELEKDAMREVAKGNSEPSRVDFENRLNQTAKAA